MATIRSYVFWRHARVEASSMLVVFRNGRLTKSGNGIDVWFLAQGGTSLLEVPADDRDHVITVSATTRDFQTISVQGIATWRAADALKLAGASTSRSILPAAPTEAIRSPRSTR